MNRFMLNLRGVYTAAEPSSGIGNIGGDLEFRLGTFFQDEEIELLPVIYPGFCMAGSLFPALPPSDDVC